ncbi:MAG: hypothetical protein WCI73_06375 [Phycisphaerae bacterium]
MGKKAAIKKTSKASWLVRGLVCTFAGFIVWQLGFSHTYESGRPLTYAEARRHSPISLPPSARNIWIAKHRQWVGFEEYVRFEAPLAECEAFAESLLQNEKLAPVDLTDQEPRHPISPKGIHDLSWFDLAKVKNGLRNDGNMTLKQIYIDRDRGVFYYVNSD